MRLPDSVHRSRPWRIHELVPDFRLEDVWALPTPGGPDDFRYLVEGMAAGDPLGALLGWDDPVVGAPTLRDRLPADLRGGPSFERAPFTPLYLTDDEWAAEIVNRTVHGVMHIGWVRDDELGAYRGEMAVYVKPNGRLGHAYMAAIRPFRHLVVYPPLLRNIEREWRARGPAVQVGTVAATY